MAEVTFPEAFGGDGKTYTDDADPDTGLDDVGYQARFVPALAGSVAMAAYAKNRAAAAEEFAETCQQLREDVIERQSDVREKQQAAAADREQTGRDRAATKADAEATAGDRQQTGEDRAATKTDTEATAGDREQTGEDRAATKADAEATAGDREQTGKDRAATKADAEATAADREQTGKDRAATKADAEATAEDRQAAQTAAAQMDADDIMHRKGSGLPNEVGTAAKRDVGTASGNLMEVGAFGLGSKVVKNWPFEEVLPDDPSALETGIYRFTSSFSGLPDGYYNATALVRRYNAEWFSMTLYSEGNSDSARSANISWRADEGWSAWDINYSSSNVVGTVRDTDGVPSGAIIESDANANGRYTKFADGTVFAWKEYIDLAEPSGSAGSTFTLSGLWILPLIAHNYHDIVCTVTFDSATYSASVARYEDITYFRGVPGNNNTDVRLYAGASDHRELIGGAIRVRLFAVYTWK
ncbi:cell envelope integrity TolA family protein [Salinicola halophyticus]|uniref:hypothetical protein n=1 Tax=Salinicola halophyticus TaxID=1808881 RepID=UPI003F44A6AE